MPDALVKIRTWAKPEAGKWDGFSGYNELSQIQSYEAENPCFFEDLSGFENLTGLEWGPPPGFEPGTAALSSGGSVQLSYRGCIILVIVEVRTLQSNKLSFTN